MDKNGIAVFDLAERRLAWTEQRQALLARNVANASTPSFQPQDLTPFAATLAQSSAEPVRTDPHHLAGTLGGPLQPAHQTPAARAPDGNTVVLDEQLIKVAETDNAQALTTAIYQKYMGMFSMALGKN
jgi:flagellar basal-body rod protein FlgB